jgi:phosphotransferase system enzyme I (PtsP)
VVGLFRWAADGDVAALDADHGLLIINPSRAEISSMRRSRGDAAADEREARASSDAKS